MFFNNNFYYVLYKILPVIFYFFINFIINWYKKNSILIVR